MAIKFIDGMRVVVPDVVARDIDDVMYEDADNPTEFLDCISPEEYQTAMAQYNGDKLITNLPQHDGYIELQRRLDLEAQEACYAQTQYMGTDQNKKDMLDLKRQIKVYTAKRVREVVEDAALTLMPRLIE